MRKSAVVVSSIVVAVIGLASSAMGSVPADSGHAAALFDRAIKDFNSTDYRGALKRFERIEDEKAEDVVTYYKGACLYQIGNYAGAIDCLSSLGRNDTMYVHAAYYLAETMLALDNPHSALRFLVRALSKDSSYAPARLEYVRTLCAVDSFREAEHFVRRTENEDEALALAQALVKAKRYGDAYSYVALVVSTDSTNTLGRLLLGEIYFQTGKYSYAEKVYSMIASSFGASPSVLRRVALCYGNMPGRRNQEKAISMMSRYLAVSCNTAAEDPKHIGAWYYQLAEYDSAENYFRQTIGYDSSDPQARLNLGLALMKLGRYDEAINSMSLAYTLSKNSMGFSISILKSLAAAELRSKEYSRAIRNYSLIHELNPDDCEAVYGLGLAYDQSGKTAEALYWYRKFVSMKSQPGMNADFDEYARSRIDSLKVKRND